MTTQLPQRSFVLPEERNATAPPEARGLARDEVRLLVAGDRLDHAIFRELPTYLKPGDLVVVNNSATLNAAVDVTIEGEPAALHFATWLDETRWVVEVRTRDRAPFPDRDLAAGSVIQLVAGGSGPRHPDHARRHPDHASRDPELAPRHHGDAPAHPGDALRHPGEGWDPGLAAPGAETMSLVLRAPWLPPARRLWVAELDRDPRPFLSAHGYPITYAYVPQRWSASYYTTVFGRIPGSAEMPSAARPFTQRLVLDLIAAGITVAPITLHTGVSSPEAGEPPSPERFAVPPVTARLVNDTKAVGGRIIAVGTTVTRALESAAAPSGHVHPAQGWTELVLGPGHPARVVDGLITGWHAPGASHLDLLTAVAGERQVDLAYAAALETGYLWHEFGDSALLLR